MRWLHYSPPKYLSFKTPCFYYLFLTNAAVLCFTSSCQYFKLIQFVQTQATDSNLSDEWSVPGLCPLPACGCRLMSYFAKNYHTLNCGCERKNVFTVIPHISVLLLYQVTYWLIQAAL